MAHRREPCKRCIVSDVMNLPETRAAQALERAAELGARRRALMAELEQVTDDLRKTCAEAVRAGVSRQRVSEIVGVTRPSLYDWLSAEGVEPKPRRPRSKPDQGK